MDAAEGRSPFAWSLRASLRYDFSPVPGEEGGQVDSGSPDAQGRLRLEPYGNMGRIADGTYREQGRW